MRILIVSQYFPPEMGAPQARLSELAQRLQGQGHRVRVLTAMPNYPSGRIFEGYRNRLFVSEDVDGIEVFRAWLHPSNSQHLMPRLWSYLTFAVTALLLGTWRLGRHDVALVESPPLFLAPAGWCIARLVGARSVLMVSDIWPDILVRMGKVRDGWPLRAMLALERWSYRHFDVVALTNPGAMHQIVARFPGTRTTVISNGVDTEAFRPDLRDEGVREQLGVDDGDFLLGYCGLHGMAQGLDAVVEAAARLDHRPDIKIMMIGDGPCKADLVRAAARRGLRNLEFRDRLPKREMPAIVASCDAVVVPLSVRLPGTMPSKVYEALAAGTPVIIARGCEGERLILEHGVGAAFEPGDAEELAAAIVSLADDAERRGRLRGDARRIASRFDRGVIAARTAAMLEAVHEGRQPPDPEW